MNFPDTHRTGRLAELEVEKIFTSWSWTVGRDHIDTGYDFSVEPDTAVFRGQRFLVQVKGTARSRKGKTVAPVSKSRLRQYANNPLPVFLIRVTSEGVLHWLHVQPWARQNMSRLSGNGETRIPMPTHQTLADKEVFVSYLEGVIGPAAGSATALVELAEARSSLLSAIDPNFRVRVGVRDGAETYQISATTDEAKVKLSLTLTGDAANKAGLEDAIIYGLPTTIDVAELRITGSPLWSELGADKLSKGIVDVRSGESTACTVVLYPGHKYSLLADRYSISASLYRGQGGFAIRTESMSRVFSLDLRAGPEDRTLSRADIRMALQGGVLGTAPIQRMDDLASLGTWARQALELRSIFVELNLPEGRITMSASLDETSSIMLVLRRAYLLGVIHQVAKALDSNFVFGDETTVSEAEVSTLFLAYSLLRGERRRIGLEQVEFSPTGQVPRTEAGGLFITTALELTVGGLLLGVLPVAIDLDGYTHGVETSSRHRFTKSEGGGAVMYYDEQGATDMRVRTSASAPTPDSP